MSSIVRFVCASVYEFMVTTTAMASFIGPSDRGGFDLVAAASGVRTVAVNRLPSLAGPSVPGVCGAGENALESLRCYVRGEVLGAGAAISSAA